MTEIAAWIGLPAVLFCTSAGTGLLLERVLGLRLPDALLAPLGACTAIVLLMPPASVGMPAEVTAALLLVASVAGVVPHRRTWREEARRASGGWAGVAALGVFGLFMAPTVMTGHWSWTGYNFVNDTAFQFLLTGWIADHGTPYEYRPVSASSEVIRVYLWTRYPLGSHVHLASMTAILRVGPEVIYTAYISGLVALTGMALASLARRAAQGPVWAAAAGFAAVSAALTYHYALQGNVKEMAMLLSVATAAAAGRELLASDRPLRAVVPVAVALGAGLSVYNAAAIPYVGMVFAVLLVAALVQPGELRRRLPAVVAVGAAALVVASVPALVVIRHSLTVLQGVFGNEGAAGAGETLAHLVRPLPLWQTGGIWLDGDYRVPVAGTLSELLTVGGIVLVFALAAVAIAVCLRRRESGPLLLLGAVVVPFIVVNPRTSPYADAKMLALITPAVVLCGMLGAAWLGRLRRGAGIAAAAVIGVLVLGSVAFAYHDVQIAPTDRMADLADLGERYAGSDDLMLFNEYEEFAKYYMREARINTPTEAMTESFIELRAGGDFPGRSFDLDEIVLSYVEKFPAVIVRRKPTGSRPPGNFRLEYRNASYEVWRREPEPQVVEHMPLQDTDDALAPTDCEAVRELAGRAEPGMALLAATGPEIVTYDFAKLRDRPAGWGEDAIRPGLLVLATPGVAGTELDVDGGTYQVWLEGTFGRPMQVRVDGERVGAAHGVNTPSGWLPAGSVTLEAGTHQVEVERPGGGLAPGDGARSSLGAVAFVGPGEPELIRIEPGDAERLCDRELDWIEIVRGPGGTPPEVER